jgi:hypothetical protein
VRVLSDIALVTLVALMLLVALTPSVGALTRL